MASCCGVLMVDAGLGFATNGHHSHTHWHLGRKKERPLKLRIKDYCPLSSDLQSWLSCWMCGIEGHVLAKVVNLDEPIIQDSLCTVMGLSRFNGSGVLD